MVIFRPEGGRSEPAPSAYTQNYYHAIFSTKGRANLIAPELEVRLYPFLGGILRDLRCAMLAVNGMPDHLHVLVQYRPDLSHSDLLRHIKGRSSKWIHETFPLHATFAWQEGYGGFTVSRSAVEDVRSYIENQKRHHAKMDFKTELMELLRRHGIEFNEAEVFR